MNLDVSKADKPYVDRLQSAADKGARAFAAIYPANITKIADPDTVFFHDPCRDMIEAAIEEKKYADAKLLLQTYAEHGLPVAKLNSLVLSSLGAKAIEVAIATGDDDLFALAQQKYRHEDGPRYDFLFNTAAWYAAKGDAPKMYGAIMETLKHFGVKPTEFTKSPLFAAYVKDPDFQLAAKGKYVAKGSGGASAKTAATPKKAAPKGQIVWDKKPAKKAVHDATKAFFAALARGELVAARPMIEHDAGFEENLRALYEQMKIVDPKLKAKKWSSDLSWLADVGVGALETTDGEAFDADENPSFFVPISYKKEPTDVTADFEVRDAGESYVLACEIIHVM